MWRELANSSYISVHTLTPNLTRMRSEILGNYINSSLLAVPFSTTVAFTSSISHVTNSGQRDIRGW
jgi:hypothetical protein